MPKKVRDDLDVYSSDVASAGGSQNQFGQHSLRDTSMRMADNGGGAISAELNAELNARAKAAAERASAAYAREHQQGGQPTGGYGGYGGYGGGGAPAAPTYSYVPGTFNYQYGYKPTEFAGQYNYTPGEFTGQYGYNPTQFQYNSEYTDLINAARDRLANWNYDPNQDVSYNAYKNQYTRAGQAAMTDALARYASKTGGVASSYAASAAQQQYNNYMAQLAAKVPELEQLAYGRAADELQRYVAADQDAYNRAFNEYADWENRQRAAADTEYNNAWEQYVDWENRQRAAADTEYNNAWDQYTDWQNRLRTQADTDYDIAYRRWQTEEAAREQAAQNAYNASVAAYNAKYGGSGKGGSGSGSAESEYDFRNDPAYKDVSSRVAAILKESGAEAAANYLKSWVGKDEKQLSSTAIDYIADVYGLSANSSGGSAAPAEEKPASTKRSSDYSTIQSQAKKLVDNPQAAGAYLDRQVANGLITETEKSTILSVLGIEREANGGNYAGRNRSRIGGRRKETK